MGFCSEGERLGSTLSITRESRDYIDKEQGGVRGWRIIILTG